MAHNETKTIRITSPGHPVAIALYIAGALGGFLTVTGLAEAKAMTGWVGLTVVQVWGSVAFLAGLLVAAISLIARFETPNRARLKIECVALAVLSVCWLWYEITLVHGNGIDQILFTQNFVTMSFLGYLIRAVEIPFDMRRVRSGPKVGE